MVKAGPFIGLLLPHHTPPSFSPRCRPRVGWSCRCWARGACPKTVRRAWRASSETSAPSSPRNAGCRSTASWARQASPARFSAGIRVRPSNCSGLLGLYSSAGGFVLGEVRRKYQLLNSHHYFQRRIYLIEDFINLLVFGWILKYESLVQKHCFLFISYISFRVTQFIICGAHLINLRRSSSVRF